MRDYFHDLEQKRIKLEANKIARQMEIFRRLPIGAPVRVGHGGDEQSNYYLATYYLGLADEHRVRVIYDYPSGNDMELKVTEILASDVIPMESSEGKPNLFDENQIPRCPIDAELKELDHAPRVLVG